MENPTTILVTGGTGFIASWIVKCLLEEGYNVHATVRKKKNSTTLQPLYELNERFLGKLTLFQANLLNERDFDVAMQGVDTVIHTASPFINTGIKDPYRQLIDPAVKGTRHVLEAASRTDTVQRVVLTSSVVAIWGDAIEIYQTTHKEFDETYWNQTSSARHRPYAYSKKLAEQEAWKIAANQRKWDLVVINPGFVLGPSLGKPRGTSQEFMQQYLEGSYATGVPDLSFGIADVRDVAQAHIKAAIIPSAEGRHIVSGTVASMLEIGQLIQKAYPGRYKLPKSIAPKFLMFLIAPFLGFSWRFVNANVGIPIKINNQRSIEQLQLNYRPLSETIRDQVAQLEMN